MSVIIVPSIRDSRPDGSFGSPKRFEAQQEESRPGPWARIVINTTHTGCSHHHLGKHGRGIQPPPSLDPGRPEEEATRTDGDQQFRGGPAIGFHVNSASPPAMTEQEKVPYLPTFLVDSARETGVTTRAWA